MRVHIIIITIFSSFSFLFAELPGESKDLLDKLQTFEDAERKKVETAISEKRSAVVKLLEQQLADETRKGNLEGASSIRESINSLTGEKKQLEMPATKLPLGVSSIPKDAIRSRGHHYKIFEVNTPISWEQAREKCRALGGELGWLEREDDLKMLNKMLAPLISKRGHAPIWVGATKNAAGEWLWLNGKQIDKDFWSDISHSNSPPDQDVLVRWIASFRGEKRSSKRVIGYLCRWE